jgi:hypothetical protein
MLTVAAMVPALWELTIVPRSRRRVATACASGGPCSRYAAHTHDRAPAAHLTDPPQAVRAEDHRLFVINHEA